VNPSRGYTSDGGIASKRINGFSGKASLTALLGGSRNSVSPN